ncbi:hypothetical protein L195_g026509 [Trifolium pratense]|uniref:Uncharacterized protein n=1 Tax=Trifolium pratense TaxID=57577 RepID=A0A2K3NJG2_TRIPR|nr:hypothetical protein L195_g026509 [Trifolium pratense]
MVMNHFPIYRRIITDNPIVDDIMDPDIVRTKGCGALPTGTPSTQRHPRGCGICRVAGHNKRSCPHNDMGRNSSLQTQSPLTTTVGTQDMFDLPSQTVLDMFSCNLSASI